ncbi:MAG TPA: pyruvate kinase alpha/beta domain-containing protein, partial [Anaerolineales bacterium]
TAADRNPASASPMSPRNSAPGFSSLAVEMMDAIVNQAEDNSGQWGACQSASKPDADAQDDTYYMTLAARELAEDSSVSAIAVFTRSGRTALFLSKARPSVPISAYTPSESTYHLMNLYWGVHPHLVPEVESVEDMLHEVDKAMIARTSIQAGQRVVLICGFPVLKSRPTNMALLHTVGEEM